MIGAIIQEDIVQNVIVIDPAKVDSLAQTLRCEIVDAAPYGLQVGDLRTPDGWTRNAGGEQMILPLLDVQQYDSYTLQQKRIVKLEEQAATASEAAADEALAILRGEVTE